MTATECSICLERLHRHHPETRDEEDAGEGQYPRVLTLQCGHTYHITCIRTWLLSSYTTACPVCRKSTTDKDIALICGFCRHNRGGDAVLTFEGVERATRFVAENRSGNVPIHAEEEDENPLRYKKCDRYCFFALLLVSLGIWFFLQLTHRGAV